MRGYGSYDVAKDVEGNYIVYYNREYIGSITRKGASHFEIENRRFDRLYLAVKHMIKSWVKNNNQLKGEIK